MDDSRREQIDRWARFVKNSKGAWKKEHTAFINAQIEKSERFYRALAKTPDGKKKIIALFGIRNLDAIGFLKA